VDKIGDQLPAIGITAASLTLVFLGFLFTSWESYETPSRRTVYKKYQKRGWMAFAGMEAALLSVILGFIGIATGHSSPAVDWLGLFSLAAWAVLISLQAVTALRDIK
jgi:hypothetical protein